MLSRAPFRRSLALAALAGAALPGCFLETSPYASAVGTGGGGAGAGAGAGAAGGEGGAGAGGGTAGAGGDTAGAGGSGGSVVVPGDACPGVDSSIALYSELLIAGDTTNATDDYGSTTCGGGGGRDVVYAVKVLAPGTLRISIETKSGHNGVVYLRSSCADAATQIDCSTAVPQSPGEATVTKDELIYVVVDGQSPNPDGAFELRLFLDGCGNGIIDGKEECDDANDDAFDECDGCKVRCTPDGSTSTDSEMFVRAKTHHCYLQSYEPDSTWDEAKATCATWGGYLAVLADTGEITDLLPLLAKNADDLWIGGQEVDDTNVFTWVNDERWTYVDKQPPWDDPFGPVHEPSGGNEHCVEIYKGGTLNDQSCGDKQNYLCERPPKGSPAAEVP